VRPRPTHVRCLFDTERRRYQAFRAYRVSFFRAAPYLFLKGLTWIHLNVLALADSLGRGFLRPTKTQAAWDCGSGDAPLGNRHLPSTADWIGNEKRASVRWRRDAPTPWFRMRVWPTRKRKLSPKSVRKLPDLEKSKSAVLNSLTSRRSQRSYDRAIREFIDWYCSEPRLAFNKTVVTRYRINLEQAQYASSTTINLRLAAIRRLAYEAADCGLLSPDLAAGIRRVKGVKKHGMRIGNWLTADQGKGSLPRSAVRIYAADVTAQ
jgi:hypothetical protein